MKLHKVALGAVAAFALAATATSAMAGGRGSLKDDGRPFSWTGFYVGGQIGAGWGDNDWFTPATNYPFSWDSSGLFAGAHIGYNKQIGVVVVGVQAEINASGIGGHGADPTFAVDYTDDLNWFGSVDARLGILATPRTLVYAIGGYAFADIDHTIGSTNGAFARVSFSNNYAGWNIGGGVEHAFSGNFTARLEYRYYDFGDASFPQTGVVLPHSHEFTMHTVRGGVSYKY